MLAVTCPGCKTVLQIDERYAGTRGKCRHCGTYFTAPASPPAFRTSGILARLKALTASTAVRLRPGIIRCLALLAALLTAVCRRLKPKEPLTPVQTVRAIAWVVLTLMIVVPTAIIVSGHELLDFVPHSINRVLLSPAVERVSVENIRHNLRSVVAPPVGDVEWWDETPVTCALRSAKPPQPLFADIRFEDDEQTILAKLSAKLGPITNAPATAASPAGLRYASESRESAWFDFYAPPDVQYTFPARVVSYDGPGDIQDIALVFSEDGTLLRLGVFLRGEEGPVESPAAAERTVAYRQLVQKYGEPDIGFTDRKPSPYDQMTVAYWIFSGQLVSCRWLGRGSDVTYENCVATATIVEPLKREVLERRRQRDAQVEEVL